MSRPISPVIVMFKALPGVRLQPIGNYPGMDCPDCRLYNLEHVCEKANVLQAPMKMQPSWCGQRDYIWREVPPKGGGMSDELKPCPFCGGKAVLDHDDEGWNWVECTSCGSSSNARTSCMEDCKPLLVEAWNKRTSETGEQA